MAKTRASIAVREDAAPPQAEAWSAERSSELYRLDAWGEGWFQVKGVLLIAMSGVHGLLARWRKDFARDANRHPARFYRMMNEVPTLLLIGIVILVVVKPF